MTEAPRAAGPAAFKGFSPDAQAAIQARAITGNWELRKLQRLLSELAHFDEVNEAAAKKARNIMIGCIIGAFVSIFVAVMLLATLETPAGWLLTLALIAGAVVFGLRWSKLKKADLINDFRLCLQPGLRDIASDLDPAKKIRVRMDLAGPVTTKQKSKLEIPPGRYLKLTETIYEDPWCEVRLPLVDGTTALLEFEVKWIKRERKYRSSRGKTKYKTKWRKQCTAMATLLPPAPVTWNEAALRAKLDPKRERMKLLQEAGWTGARLERYWVFKGADDPPPDAPPAREVVGLLLRLCSAMGGASEVSR